jgi:hypothetical protein
LNLMPFLLGVFAGMHLANYILYRRVSSSGSVPWFVNGLYARAQNKGTGSAKTECSAFATSVEADLNVESSMRVGAMHDDSAYALGRMFQSFLKDQPDILENLRDSLTGFPSDGKDASDELILRFQQWLDEQDIEIDDRQRTILLQIAEAFADFAVDPEEAASLALV